MLKELKTHHRQVVRLTVQGCKPQEVSARTGIKITTVYSILRDPLAKGFMMAMEDKADDLAVDVKRELAELQRPALQVFDNLLSDADTPASVQLAAAKDVLDRNGHKPAETHKHLHGHFTSEDLATLRSRLEAQEAREAEGNGEYLEISA